ncbi:Phage shock protein B [Salmonella enterica subsp. enterica serovar Urbana str. R8-2977]|uniref:Phage shock protein B n=2 Tax=Pseudomonadati TaxID=3379134 RepID=G5RUX4_SALET|nr:Phage shock protein B [Salmonella enterica subsp. enterica serovar Urbana str. R8-2977]
MSALFLAIPLTIFVLFVLPIWLWLHYSNRAGRGELSQSEQQRLLQLTDDAQRMRERRRIQALEDILGERIQALEDILDAEHPNWRER